MQKLTLYKHMDGLTTVITPFIPENVEYEISPYVRLVADEGKALTDGETLATVIDTLDISAWQEVEAPELWEADEATEADYIEALQDLGVLE